MSIELELPNIGEGVDEADVAEVLVSVGDVIEANQTVMELETEKAIVPLPCPHAGTIEKILVSAGDTVRVGSPVLVISGGNGAETAKEAPPKKAETAESPKKEAPAESPKAKPADETPKKAPSTPARSDEGPGTDLVEGTIDFRLPPLGEGVTSADVAEILVGEGDVIQADDVVMELETEKAVVELPCPHVGKIKKIHVAEGDSIEVGALVLTLEASTRVGGEKAAPAPSPTKASREAPARPPQEDKAPAPRTETARRPETPSRSKETTPVAALEKTEEANQIPVPAAPSTRRLARQLGVDLRNVQGSARGGRITREDVQAYVRERLNQAQLPARTSGAQGALVAGSIAPPPLPDFSRFGPVDREKLNKIARTTAENLTVSWNVIPHVTFHDRADITDLEAARKRFAQGVGKNGPKVTMTALVIKALTRCLQAYPRFNSSLDPETSELVFKRYFHIGCAVDTPHGLLVPVVRDCDRKSILEIAREIATLAEQARDRKLPVDAMQGATCTVTNLGGIGGVGFSPIINYPEVCILGMSRGQQELRLIDGKVEERLMLPLSLSFDHRVINGADAARFVVALVNLLSDPFQLLTIV